MDTQIEIPQKLEEALRAEARKMSKSLFRIGDLANRVYLHNVKREKPFHDWQVWSEVGALVGKGGRRVQRIADVAKFFTPDLRVRYDDEYSFSHFEVAYAYHLHEGGDALALLDFVGDYRTEHCKMLPATRMVTFWKVQIEGSVTWEDLMETVPASVASGIDDGGAPMYRPYSYQILHMLRQLVSNPRLSAETRQRADQICSQVEQFIEQVTQELSIDTDVEV